MIPLAQIADNPFRAGFPPDEAEVVHAAYLVRDHGMAFPLVVRSGGGGYELGAGQRWLAACRLLGVATVPAMVADLDDAAMATLAYEEAAQSGTLTQGHSGLILRGASDPRVSSRLARLREGGEEFRVQVDPEAARNLPVPRQAFLQPATASDPAALPVILDEDQPDPPPPPRGIYDALLGLRCRVLPANWFQTVGEAGRRWVLESMASGGQIEVLACPVPAPTLVAAVEGLRQHLLARHPGSTLSPERLEEPGGFSRVLLDLQEASGGARHRHVLLWKEGCAVTLKLSNAARFFLYDLTPFEAFVEGTQLL